MTRQTVATRVLIVDDHQVVRAGLQKLLERCDDIEVVGEAGTAADAIELAQRLEPDIVLMDVRLPDASGVEACREIRSERPATRVVFLTAFGDDATLFATACAGAEGYLLKEIDASALLESIRKVARGLSLLDPATAAETMDRMTTAATSTDERLPALSPQEQRVLALVAEGKTNKEIAAALGLSHKTVKNYLANVFQKIQVRHRAQAAAFFVKSSRR